MTAPERIWADMWPYDFPGFSPCFTWHHPDSIEDGTEGLTSYVRADLHEEAERRAAALLAEKERLEAERDGWRARCDISDASAAALVLRLRDAKARAARLEEAGNRLSFAAQTTGGTAGRDEGLCAAIDAWTAALADAPREGETREGEGE
jgi:hypothetical protein